MGNEKTADTSNIVKALERPERKIVAGMTLAALLKTDTIGQRFNDVLGKEAAAFTSSILSAVSANPDLANCTPLSCISSAMIAATVGLPINPSLGFAYKVPYKGIATFQMGWKGFVQLGMRSGQYKTMNATEIYEGEVIKYNRLTGLLDFDQDKKTSDKIVGYAFYFQLLNGYEKVGYWTREKCEAHGKQYSKTYQKGKGQWVRGFDSMALKTVVKNTLSKWGLLSIEMKTAIQADQAVKNPDGSFSFPDSPEGVQEPVEPSEGQQEPASGAGSEAGGSDPKPPVDQEGEEMRF